MILTVLQVVSLVFVAAALMVSVHQSKLVSKQASTAQRELYGLVLTSIAHAHSNHRMAFFREDADLRSWYLQARGYLSTGPLEDAQRLFALTRLDEHESIFLQHRNALVDDSVWQAWRQVLLADLQMKPFQDVWPNAQRFYESSFAAVVSAEISAGVAEGATSELESAANATSGQA